MPIEVKYISVSQFAEKFGLSERTTRNYCAVGKIAGAFLTGKTWNIPEDATPPKRKKAKISPLLTILQDERKSRRMGGIYHRTQIDLTYNSNHIEGSRLTHDETRFIFETNTLGATRNPTNVDDIMETVNHFRCIDYVIDHTLQPLTESFIKQLHSILKTGTSDSNKEWFAVGDYKKLPNEVGGVQTTDPKNVHKEIKTLLKKFNAIQDKSFADILDFHVQFEKIHPFQDGNGRIGRLLLFYQCLANNIVPFIITENLRYFYYRGLQQWGKNNEYLMDTCLSAQDSYKALLDYFRIKY